MTGAPTIVSLATAVPEHDVSTDEARRLLETELGRFHSRDEIARFFASVRVERRHLAAPGEWIVSHGKHSDRAAAYRQASLLLGERALRDCLDGLPGSVRPDTLVTASCTGLTLPSIDAFMISRLGLSPTATRLPIGALGCAAGAAGLRLAATSVATRPERTAAFLSVETPSLTFNPDDPSRANVIAAALFGDGGAAALVRWADRGGMQILDAATELIPGTEAIMGFSIADTGFLMELSPRLPVILKHCVLDQVTRMLDNHGVTVRDMGFAAIHPGGPRILEVFGEVLGLPEGMLAPSYAVLRDHGNMSSASVLFVLRHILDHQPPVPGTLGLLAAVGPGLSVELLLLRAT